MKEKQKEKISKLLSLVLRHKPETIHLELDENGWVDVETLIKEVNLYRNIDEGGIDLLTSEILEEIVVTNDKQRFNFNEDKTKIRANQGHTIEVNLDLIPKIPPKYLYHGTTSRVVDSILDNGINKGERNHLHLSIDVETAFKVGRRHVKDNERVAIFTINSFEAHKNGILFYCSENGVWLTVETIPSIYIYKIERYISNDIQSLPIDISFMALYR